MENKNSDEQLSNPENGAPSLTASSEDFIPLNNFQPQVSAKTLNAPYDEGHSSYFGRRDNNRSRGARNFHRPYYNRRPFHHDPRIQFQNPYSIQHQYESQQTHHQFRLTRYQHNSPNPRPRYPPSQHSNPRYQRPNYNHNDISAYVLPSAFEDPWAQFQQITQTTPVSECLSTN